MLNVFEGCFAILMLLYLSSGLTGFLSGDSPLNLWRVEDNPLLLAIQTVMYAVTLGFVVLHWRKFTTALQSSGWVVALAFFAIASTLWSSDPGFTLRRSLVVVATTVFGIYFGSRFDLRRQLRLLGWMFIVLAVLSTACALCTPQYGIDNHLHRGDWQGILGQKNLLGKAMAVAIIVMWSAKGLQPRTMRIAARPVCAAVMLMSGSKTALLVCGALLLMALGYRVLRSHPTTLVPLLVVLAASAAGAVFLAADSGSRALAYLGRNATLTRRTEIWSAVWSAISSRMLLGYGFSGFWAGIHGESAQVAGRLGFVARHAHNGFLDLWLELGIAGLLLFVAGYFQAVRNGIRLLRRSCDRHASWPLLYLAFVLLYDLVEGPILRQNNLYWALYVAIVVSASRAAHIKQRSPVASSLYVPALYHRVEQQPGYLS